MRADFAGGLAIEAALQALGDKAVIRRTAERALKRAAEPIRDRWIELAPEDQGDLKGAIKIGRAIQQFQRTSSGDVVRTFVGIDESVNARLHIYAEVEEFGNANHPAQPAGRPAWESEKMTAFNRLADDLRAEIVKTGARQARKRARASS